MIKADFQALKEIKAGDNFEFNGFEYLAEGDANVFIRGSYEYVNIEAKRRKGSMPSGWECADISEARIVGLGLEIKHAVFVGETNRFRRNGLTVNVYSNRPGVICEYVDARPHSGDRNRLVFWFDNALYSIEAVETKRQAPRKES